MLAAAAAVAAATASGARAQLPPLPPLGGQPSPGPSQPAPSPAPPGPGPATGAVVSYFGNPARTGESTSREVFGPVYRAWAKRFSGYASQPLIVGGRVIVNVSNGGSASGYGSRVIAFERLTGRQVWEQPTPGTYFSAHIAADQGRVVSLNTDGLLRAFDISSGAYAWSRQIPGAYALSSPPVAAGGLAFVTGQGTLFAVSMSDGSIRWQRQLPFGGTDQMPALDDRRVFLGNSCGGAVAFERTTGNTAWSRGESSCSLVSVLVSGGLVYSAGGHAWQAATGADAGTRVPGMPEAVSGRLGIFGPDDLSRPFTTATSLADGRQRWRYRDAGKAQAAYDRLLPISSGGTVYAGGYLPRISALDGATGTLRATTTLKGGSSVDVGGIRGGMSAGQGVLAVAQGNALNVLRPVFAPGERGVDIALDAPSVYSGQRSNAYAAVGASLRARPQNVTLEADRHPYGRFRPARKATTLGDGIAAFRPLRITKNTHLRVRGRGVSRPSHVLRVYAFPRVSFAVRRIGRTRARIRVTLRGPKDLGLAGRKVYVYYVRGGSRRYTRLGGSRLRRAGRGRVRASVRVRVPRRVGRRDSVAYCVKNLARLGLGSNDVFSRRCGRRALRG